MTTITENKFKSENRCNGIQESYIIPILLSSLSATELCLMFLIENDNSDQNIFYRSRNCQLFVENGKYCISCQELFDSLNHFHNLYLKKPCEQFHNDYGTIVKIPKLNSIKALEKVTVTLCEELKTDDRSEEVPLFHNICKECGEVFGDKVVLESHVLMRHSILTLGDGGSNLPKIQHSEEEKNVADSEAHKTTAFEDDHIDNAFSKVKQNNFPCEYCGLSFKKRKNMYNHMSKVHMDFQEWKGGDKVKKKRRTIQCPFCPEVLMKRSMHGHLLTNHFDEKDSTRYQEILENCKTICSHCGKNFYNKSTYTKHLNNEHSEKIVKDNYCSICGKSFVTKNALDIHTEKVHGTNTEYCVECDISFGTKQNFTHHLKEVHLPKLDCIECGKRFSERNLVRHMKVAHVKEKQFSCKECPKKFAFQDKLKNHNKAVHLNIRAYGCEKCSYKASGSFNLNLHRRKMHQATDKLNKLKLIEMIESGNHPFCGNEFIPMLNN